MTRSRKQKLRAFACAMISPLILIGCASVTDTFAMLTRRAETVDVNAVACGAFKPIKWSRGDTDGTLEQIHEHNAAYEALCGAPAEP